MANYDDFIKINENDEMDTLSVECYPVAINKDGWNLMEYELTTEDSSISIETVCELFPDYHKVDINKGYILMKDGVYYYE